MFRSVTITLSLIAFFSILLSTFICPLKFAYQVAPQEFAKALIYGMEQEQTFVWVGVSFFMPNEFRKSTKLLFKMLNWFLN